MKLIPKIKDVKKIYAIKIKIRSIKHLFKNIFFLIINLTDFKKVFNYIVNFTKKIKIDVDRDYFYKNKIFDHGDWLTHKVPLIMDYFNNKSKNDYIEILEIGSWEGRSACFFLRYFKNSKITCVDTWGGSSENFNDITTNLEKVEKNFDKNVLDFKNRVTKSKAKSKKFFEENRRKFDFIYIDGSHYYDDVLNDAKEGFKILKEDCYMLLDDCDWNFYEYGKNPINAINLFLKLNKEKIEIIYISSQILIKKIKS